MKQIGVITMYQNNYGAFLQAYALQTKLKTLGYEAELIAYDNSKEKTLLGVPYSLLNKPHIFLKRLFVEIILYKKHRDRKKVFEKSIGVNLKESEKKYYAYQELLANPPVYDIYLSGSDQVFNPNLEPQAFRARLLEFAKGDKVSYAASAGNVNALGNNKTILLDNIRQFKHISVREESLKEFIKGELDVEVSCNVDPSLLLDKKEWSLFSRRPSYLPEKYIFYYRVLVQPELKEIAESLSKKLNIPVFAADGHAKFSHQVNREGFLSPEEWVGALLNAEYVVTNSFHGTAFSVNFHKKARIVLPPENTSRIVDLIAKGKLERLYQDTIISDKEIPELYEKIDQVLKDERLLSERYLSDL